MMQVSSDTLIKMACWGGSGFNKSQTSSLGGTDHLSSSPYTLDMNKLVWL